jgi:hypothetical protein
LGALLAQTLVWFYANWNYLSREKVPANAPNQ